MRAMFMRTEYFNQDLNSWDVSRVANLSDIFDGAASFNHTLCTRAWADAARRSQITDGYCSRASSSVV